MKKSRFTEAQIMGVLRQAEGGLAVPELCREHGISSATFDRTAPLMRYPGAVAAGYLRPGALSAVPGALPSSHRVVERHAA